MAASRARLRGGRVAGTGALLLLRGELGEQRLLLAISFCSEFFSLVSLALSAAFASLVRSAACCAPVSWRAAARNWVIVAALSDDSSVSIEAWLRICCGSPEVSSTSGDVSWPFM